MIYKLFIYIHLNLPKANKQNFIVQHLRMLILLARKGAIKSWNSFRENMDLENDQAGLWLKAEEDKESRASVR